MRDRRTELAVLHHPGLGHTYAASSGVGAWRDGERIRPSGKADPRLAPVATGLHERLLELAAIPR